MDRMLYIAMTGAKETMLAQAIQANNLANATTGGFRAELSRLESFEPDNGRLPSRAFAVTQESATDFTPSTIMTTGRDLDVAIDGAGFLAVQNSKGQEAYTRAGRLDVDSSGQLKTSSGYTVVGGGGPISIPPSEHLEIAGDGTINIQPLGQATGSLAVVDRLKLVNPDTKNLKRGEDGLFYLTQGTAEFDGSVKVVSGALEASNVSAVSSMIDIMSLARQFEIQLKLMKAAEDNDASSAQILRMNS